MNRQHLMALTNRQKAAIVLLALGPQASAQVLRHLGEEDVEALTLDVAQLGRVEAEARRHAIAEFCHLCRASEGSSRGIQGALFEGGIEQARVTLEAAFGAERATEVVSRVSQTLKVMPFDFAKRADPSQLLSFIQEEHPQTIALILAHLPPNQAAAVLAGLPQEARAEVARRIAGMDRTPPEVVYEIERVLERKLSSTIVTHGFMQAGGVKALVEMLNWVDRSTEKTILQSLSETNPEMAEEVKKLMFVFEDIILLDDVAIQKVLREVDTKELALALKGVSEEVQQRIFRNLSERAAAILHEDMEFMGPVRLRSVQEAQQRIVGAIRRLEEAGDIVIARGGDEIIV
ncbi:MAG TPA: flagellar motor switch protein FliG [Chthonomonadaceae bacterium]|nr:flagellar motor switch protein FliG [Chthonomonadaceae bacterium]